MIPLIESPGMYILCMFLESIKASEWRDENS